MQAKRMISFQLLIIHLWIVAVMNQSNCSRSKKALQPLDYYRAYYNHWVKTPYNKAYTPLSDLYDDIQNKLTRQRCGSATVDPNSAIVGGRTAKDKAWPWYAKIIFRNKYNRKRGLCGGSLLDERWVLSAAHCVVDSKVEYVVLGNLTKNDTIRRSYTTVIHEDYEAHSNNNPSDIALIKLYTPVTFSDEIQPICLPEIDTNFEKNPDCYAMGFGFVGTNPLIHVIGYSDTLQQIKVNITPQAICAYVWNMDDTEIDSRHICTDRTRNYGICIGDSGSPLCCKYGTRFVVAGVASFIAQGSCNSELVSDVFVRVSEYRNWIIRMIYRYQFTIK
ncbi:chymotrypsin-like elastase family member 2A [Biomphalaria glabrata]|uniref:Chymotrypsin-like elastase family member 2A n=1 Tax=Biomphalaria glabrata TaxID=6526 RepID=A0A9W3A8S6_BIOGL|nr:chymotrypsin-like elastase family member 2A [Biomphalaria glabrata]